MKKIKVASKGTQPETPAAKTRIAQAEVPGYDLNEALRVARAIIDHYGGRETRPLDVAAAMEMQPTTGKFRGLCGASIAYGLTEGGYNAESIEVTQLGRRILVPTEEGADATARREAALRPRIIREFLEKYDGAKYPREDIARNVLVSLGAPPPRAKDILELIERNAAEVGLFQEISGTRYVALKGAAVKLHAPIDAEAAAGLRPGQKEGDEAPARDSPRLAPEARGSAEPAIRSEPKLENRKVFVTHGKNKDLIPQLKELLTFGKFEPIVSVERESVSKPVPDKVLDDMRICTAAIIHVDADRELITSEGTKEVVISANVLIEIGAAMALYRRRFILLVHKGVRLPSNLQGLYEVRYEGEKLDGDATLRLLKAFNEFNVQ